MSAATLDELLGDQPLDRSDDSLSARLIAIGKEIDAVEDRLDFVVDRTELADAVCEASALLHRSQALLGRVGMVATNNNVASENGQRTIGQFIAARTNGEGLPVNRLVRSAKWLRDFPIFEAAFGAELTNAHVDYLRKNLDTTYDTHRLLKHDQQIFVDAARDCSFQDFIEVCAYWLVHVDPDGKEPKDQIERSNLRIGVGRGGRGEIKATCDAITRQKLDTAVEHEAAKLRKQDNAAGIERTDSQRRMAALTALVERGAQREDGTYPVPLANIVMSQAVYDWGLGVLNGTIDPADTVPVNAFDIDGRCELIDGTPIHPFVAIMAMGNHGLDCHGQPNLRRYVLDAKSRVLDMSVNARSAPEWQRTGTLIETRGRCSTHGCEAPHHWLVSDHVKPVAHGGETEFHNIQPLCRPDNQAKAATPGLTAWRHRPHPARRRPRPRGAARRRPDPEAF